MGRPRSIGEFITAASRSGRIPSGTASIVEDIYQTPKVIRQTRKRALADGPGSLRSEMAQIGAERSKMPIDKAFWNLVNQPDEGCWDWMGGPGRQTTGGYGNFGYRGRKYPAHKLAFELSRGRPVADGMNVLHHCDRGVCCRPEHLYEGTTADNLQDMRDRREGKRPAAYDITHITASMELDGSY